MRRIKLCFLFLALALLALVNPKETEDMLECAEAGAAMRRNPAVPGRREQRIDSDLSVASWLMIFVFAGIGVVWLVTTIVWFFSGAKP